MVVHQADAPTWAIGIAEALEEYLLAAAALPPPDEQPVVPHQPTGWYAPTPGGPPSGRTPWIHLSAISIACFGETIALSFRWKPDSPEVASTYLLPMTTVRSDPTTESDALITRLDFFLDTPWRERQAPREGQPADAWYEVWIRLSDYAVIDDPGTDTTPPSSASTCAGSSC